MIALVKRLERLRGDNPVQSVKLTPEDWPTIAALIGRTP